MENISKLEKRLEQSRRQRKVLKHELGAGKPCLSCKEKCVGGLNLHFWRKICINCKCPKLKHDLLPEDLMDEDNAFEVLGVKIPEHKKLYKYMQKTATENKDVEWVPFVYEKERAMSDKKRNEKINKYFEELGGEKQIPFENSEAAKLRKEQQAYQIPSHDFNPEKCDQLTEVEKAKLIDYVNTIKDNYFGQGLVDVIESKTNMPAGPYYSHKTDLNVFNNNNLPDMVSKISLHDHSLICRRCKLSITSAYVNAERLGKDAQFHPTCFSCKKCSQLLVDLIYFHFDGEIYCARDLATKMDIPRCSACDELILVPEFTLADEQNYHIKHFCCIFCDKPLAGLQYVNDEETGNPICLGCYDLHHANKCSICSKIIAPNEEGLSLKELHYHLACFRCSNRNCGKELIGSRFCIKENIPFCSATCVSSTLKH